MLSWGNFLRTFDFFDQLLEGLLNTLFTSITALILSLLFGIIISMLRFSNIRFLELFARWYVEFLRNIPLLVTVFFFYYGLPKIGIQLSGLASGTIGLVFYTTAYIAEVIRSGIQSIDKGQMEAARSSGLSYIQSMVFIIMPQAIKIIIPPLGNQFITIVKNSAVLAFVAGNDLMYRGDILAGNLFIVFEVFIVVWLLYLLLTIPLSILVNYLELRLNKIK